MKRTVLIFGLIILCNSAMAWAQELPLLVARQGYADLVLTSGKIATMDDRSSLPNTLAQVRPIGVLMDRLLGIIGRMINAVHL